MVVIANQPLLGTLGPFRDFNVCGILAPTPESFGVRVRHDVADVTVLRANDLRR
jgi:hypothetical protein